ncbi:MAG: PocR ligand-binding domain-containing protein, partial [Planctomycetota bacterium]
MAQPPDSSSPPPPPTPAGASSSADHPLITPTAPRLSLTDFVDLGTLQEIQDAFASVTRLSTTILDADGQPATLPTDAEKRHQSDLVFEQLIDVDEPSDPAVDGTRAEGGVSVSGGGAKQFQAPITVEGQTLGSIIIEPAGPSAAELAPDLHELEGLADALNLDAVQRQELIDSAELAFGTNRGAAIQFLYLMANAIARLCFEQYHAQQRLEELSVL